MKSILIYDSAYGNTAKISKAIADCINCDAVLINDFNHDMVEDIELIIIGTPTQGGMATKPIQELLKSLKKRDMKVAVFDTRFAIDGHGMGLKLLMKTIGFAAPKMAKHAKTRGFKVIGEPAGFIVSDKEGPLIEGEIELAQDWAKSLIKN